MLPQNHLYLLIHNFEEGKLLAIKKDPSLIATQEIIDSIPTLRLRTTANLSRIKEIQAKSKHMKNQPSAHSAYRVLISEHEERIRQNQHDQHNISLFNFSWFNLSDEEQRILHVFHHEKLTREAAIALLCDELGRSEATIWRRYRKALRHLADIMSL
jgi:hypothetical protein